MSERLLPLVPEGVAPLVIERAAATELLVLDVDGVLTDGRLYYDRGGEAMKVVDVRDGHGIVMLRHAGIRTAILSGRNQPLLAERFLELRVALVKEASFVKGEDIVALAEELGVDPSLIAFVGDDVNDVAAMEKVGLPCCPLDAAPEALAAALFVSTRKGGRGAVREVSELILKAKNRWPLG